MRPAADVRVARHDSVMAVQTAVTELLKQHSLGSPLWTAYASWEAVHGSIQVGAWRSLQQHEYSTAGLCSPTSNARVLV